MLFIPFVHSKEVSIPEVFETEKAIASGETTYFYAGSKLIASKGGDIISYHYQDRLGSDVESKSLPFGQSIEKDERFSFTGKELDSELHYFNARYYDSNLGRFTSVDPIPGELSYGYVMNNPVMYVDPTGMATFEGLGRMNLGREIKEYNIYEGPIQENVGGGGIQLIKTNFGNEYERTVSNLPGGQMSALEDPLFIAITGVGSTFLKSFSVGGIGSLVGPKSIVNGFKNVKGASTGFFKRMQNVYLKRAKNKLSADFMSKKNIDNYIPRMRKLNNDIWRNEMYIDNPTLYRFTNNPGLPNKHGMSFWDYAKTPHGYGFDRQLTSIKFRDALQHIDSFRYDEMAIRTRSAVELFHTKSLPVNILQTGF